jgi:ABC-type methionine transport system permease subunit
MKEFTSILLGDQPAVMFFALLFYALMGAFLGLLLQTTTRHVNSQRTPYYFSWQFLLSDNVKRIVAGLILIYVALRFTPELFGVNITPFWAIVIGLANDKIAEVLKNKTNLLGKK